MASLSDDRRTQPALRPPESPSESAWSHGAWFVGITGFALAFLLFQIGFPATHNYDEFHYVPAAKEVIATITNRNYEHPPLGKFLIAAGIAVFGDNPVGWRFMNVLFGAFTLGAIYLWARALFEERRAALFTVGLTFANFLFVVQSRIGMLDGFMVAFMAGGLAAWAWAERSPFDSRRRTLLLASSGILLGLSTASKWVGVLALAWVGTLALLEGEWRRPLRLATTLGLLPALAYFTTFLPFFAAPDGPEFSWAALWAMQTRMFDGQLRVVSDHPYNAGWWTWPLMLRPIWYAFEREADPAFFRGVLMIGNPLLMWGGLAFLGLALRSWVRTRSKIARHVVVGYAFLYLSWIIIPRKIAFYYYYYPAALLLGFAVSAFFHESRSDETGDRERRFWKRMEWLWFAACAVFFAWFYPILSAARVPSAAFRLWAWFRAWI